MLCRYAKPISVARCILEHPSLSMLVGSGATEFALNEGFPMEDNSSLLSEMTSKAYEVSVGYIDESRDYKSGWCQLMTMSKGSNSIQPSLSVYCIIRVRVTCP